MENKLNETTLVDRIDELSEARKEWENGTYAAANAELYTLLERCLVLFKELSGERKLIMLLNTLLTVRGLKPQTNTSLAVKIVRLVFGDCGKRAYYYANVLTIAAEEKRDNESMALFVGRKGGVEEIRRSAAHGGKTRAQLKQEFVDFAAEALSTANGIGDELPLADALKPHKESATGFSVALIRGDATGKGVIVYGTNNETLVQAVLEVAGKQLKPAAEEAAKNQSDNDRTVTRTGLISGLAA